MTLLADRAQTVPTRYFEAGNEFVALEHMGYLLPLNTSVLKWRTGSAAEGCVCARDPAVLTAAGTQAAAPPHHGV